jgi:hypothetical protein
MAGAEEFCALRSYLATTARHGIGALGALTAAFRAIPGSPKPDSPDRHQSAGQPEPESRSTYLVTSDEGLDGAFGRLLDDAPQIH